jgi:hypothetical protein
MFNKGGRPKRAVLFGKSNPFETEGLNIINEGRHAEIPSFNIGRGRFRTLPTVCVRNLL